MGFFGFWGRGFIILIRNLRLLRLVWSCWFHDFSLSCIAYSTKKRLEPVLWNVKKLKHIKRLNLKTVFLKIPVIKGVFMGILIFWDVWIGALYPSILKGNIHRLVNIIFAAAWIRLGVSNWELWHPLSSWEPWRDVRWNLEKFTLQNRSGIQ